MFFITFPMPVEMFPPCSPHPSPPFTLLPIFENHLTRPSDPSYASVVLHVRIPSWSWQSVAPSIKKHRQIPKKSVSDFRSKKKQRVSCVKLALVTCWKILMGWKNWKWQVTTSEAGVRDDLLSILSKLMRWMENYVWHFEGSPKICWKMFDYLVKFCMVSHFQYGAE